MKKRTACCICTALVFAFFLSGCTSTPGLEPGAQPWPPYIWGTYQEQIHAFLTGANPGAQLIALEQDLQRIITSGRYPPPGLHAQLGLLHAETGNRGAAIAFFQEEKAFFPEAEVFMNFLITMLGE